MSAQQGDNDKPAAPTGGWMKVSRPHKALPQVPPPKDQSGTTTPPTESPPQSVSSVPSGSSEATPVGSPSTANSMTAPPTAKWRAVKVQAADQAATRAALVTSNDSNSSANGSEPTNTTPPTEENKKVSVIIILILFEDSGQ